MAKEQIIGMAIEEGFSDACIVATSEIVFDSSFRSYCEENLCGRYGANYSCPPDCGSPEDMRRKILKYKNALVLKTAWDVPDFTDSALIKSAKQSHAACTFSLVERLEKCGLCGLAVGTSGCSLCVPCARSEGKPCKFPEKRYSCMSAYCIDVKDLAGKCDMTYNYKGGILPLFGMYAFD